MRWKMVERFSVFRGDSLLYFSLQIPFTYLRWAQTDGSPDLYPPSFISLILNFYLFVPWFTLLQISPLKAKKIRYYRNGFGAGIIFLPSFISIHSADEVKTPQWIPFYIGWNLSICVGTFLETHVPFHLYLVSFQEMDTKGCVTRHQECRERDRVAFFRDHLRRPRIF